MTGYEDRIEQEDPMIAFYRRDNEELRKFLTAERVENNSLRSAVSSLKEAVGMGVAALELLGDQGTRESADSDSIDAVTTRMRQLSDKVQ